MNIFGRTPLEDTGCWLVVILLAILLIIFALYLRSFTTDENPIMRIISLAIVVSAIVIAFAFRYEPVVTATPGSTPLDRRWSFDRWFGEFHPEK